MSLGKRARKIIDLPLGAPVAPTLKGAPQAPAEPVIRVGLRPLTSGEIHETLARARADAIAHGVTHPQEGNPTYDLAEMEWTLLLCCVDPDSPEGSAPAPFFASIEEIRTAPDLGRERVTFLFARWKLWQLEMSPDLRQVTPEEFIAGLGVLGGEDEPAARDFFSSLGPGLQWSYMRSLALQWQSSPKDRSTSF